MKKTSRVLLPLSILVVAMSLVSCGEQSPLPKTEQETNISSQPTNVNQNNLTTIAMNPNTNSPTTCVGSQTDMPANGEEIVVMETTMGTIKMRLFSCDAPQTVKNFEELISKGYYDGLIFHRVIKDFMMQGGDPTGTGTGGESYLGKDHPIPDETNKWLSHLYGAVAMAKSGPNTAGSQFYIVNNKAGYTALDSGYTVFGQVFEGFDTIDAIANVETDKCSPYERRLGCDKPFKDVVMKKVTLEKYSK